MFFVKNSPTTGNMNKPEVEIEVSKEWPQVLALLSAALAGLNSGILFTWPSPAIPHLLSGEYNVSIDAASYLIIIPPIAMIIASPLYCRLPDKIGRKKTLLSSSIFQVAAWLVIAFARQIYVFYISRVLSGIGDACVFATMPIYTSEVSTPQVRGRWGNAMMILMFVGQIIINAVGYYCDIQTTAFIMLFFPILFFCTFIFMPETPYYHLKKDDQNSSRECLKRLRRCENVENELQQLTSDLQRQLSEPGNFKDLFIIESNRKAFLISNLARVIQQFCGISAFAVYTQFIFLQIGGDISSGHSAIIFHGMLALVNTFASLISDRLGRTKSMIASCVGCGFVLLCEAVYFFLQTHVELDMRYINWFPLLALFVYVLLFAIGLGIVPTLLMGELFSTSIRVQASLANNLVFAVMLCVVPKLFQVLLTSFGLWLPFLFFSICCFAGAIASYFFIPETRGKTLEEIQQMLKRSAQK